MKVDVDVDKEVVERSLTGSVGRVMGSRDRGVLSCCGQKKKHTREA